jgi:hypothetical protein
MPRFIDLTGNRFERLVVHKQSDRRGGRVHWHCVCECGAQIVVAASSLRSGNTRSCGCLVADTRPKRERHYNFRHGLAGTPTYRSWTAARERCQNPRNERYPQYGGRGITVCERWADFDNFLADMGEAPPGHTLDRIRVNEPYEPGNCRWLPRAEQALNRRNSIHIDYEGRQIGLKEFASAVGLPYGRLVDRVHRRGLRSASVIPAAALL